MENIQLESLAKTFAEQNEYLEKQIEDLNREVKRKTYITTELSALIILTNDQELIHKASEVAEKSCKI